VSSTATYNSNSSIPLIISNKDNIGNKFMFAIDLNVDLYESTYALSFPNYTYNITDEWIDSYFIQTKTGYYFNPYLTQY